MKNKKPLIKLTTKVLSTAAVLFLFAYFSWVYILPRLNQHESKKNDIHLVIRVIDGDTFELEDKERVRLLGIDTPEKYESAKLEQDAERSGRDKKTLQRLGRLASDYSKKLVEGKKVILIPEYNYEDKDVYGRLLRYVYLEDGTFINRKIVEDGYAYAYRKYNISKLGEFIQCENEARQKKKGLWGEVEGLNQFDTTGTKPGKIKPHTKSGSRKK